MILKYFNKLLKTRYILFILNITFLFPILIFFKLPGYHPFSIEELLIVGILIFYTIYLMKLKMELKSNTKLPTIYVFILIIYIVYQFILLFASDSYIAGISSILLHDKYIILSILAFYFIDYRNEHLLLKFLVLVGIMSIYLSLLKILKDPTILMSLYSNYGGFKRETGIFRNSNMFGVYILIISFLEIYFLEIINKKFNRIFFIIFVILPTLIILLLTFSRRSWGLFIFGFVIYILMKRGNKLFIIVSILSLFLLSIKFLDYDSIIYRFMQIFDSDYKSNYMREEAFSEQFNFITSNFFTFLGGAGVGLFGPSSIFINNPKWAQIDNYYAELLLEYGIIGVVLYLTIFLIVLLYGMKTLNFIKQQRVYNKILIFIIIHISLYISAIVGSTPISFPLNLFQWIIIGLILKNYKIYKGFSYEKAI